MDIKTGRFSYHARKKETDYSKRSTGKATAISLCFFLIPLFSFCQTAQLEISAPTEVFFFVIQDNKLVSTTSQNKICLPLNTIGTKSIWVITDSLFQAQKFTLDITEPLRYIFELGISNDKLALLPISTSEVKDLTIPETIAKSKKNKPNGTIGRTVPNLTADSLLQLVSLNGYHGKHNCESPFSLIRFEEEIAIIKSKPFESQRLQLVTDLIVNNCILVEQLGELLGYFEFDDTKLALIAHAIPHIFDVDNLPSLRKKISFSVKKDRFDELLSK